MFRTLFLAGALLAAPVHADGTAGPYLAARIAGFSNDYRAAGDYYSRLMRRQDVNTEIVESAIIIFSVLGRFDDAVDAAETLDEETQPSQFARAAQMITALRDGRLADAQALLDDGGVGGALLDGLLTAWIAAADGETARALAAFDTLAETEGFAPFAWTHKAYALAMAGDFEGADDILSGRAHGPLPANARAIAAHAQVLSQLEQPEVALDLLQKATAVSNSPVLEDLEARISAGEQVFYDMVATPQDGMAEAYFTLAALLAGESSTTFTLLNARGATVLRPDHVDALILVADLLESQDQHDLANAALTAVPREHPVFFAAELARAEVLLSSDREEAAIEVLQSLTRSRAERKEVWAAYADALRRLDRHSQAVEAYDRAIALDGGAESENWFWIYARGISRERTGNWAGAEADFRRALELNPEQPNVLNYLGYGLVEQRIKLDEALDLIERAVAARPDDGYITDSLGWALYRLGRFEEAVEPMERAVMLRPLDPLINDHLGDVLWQVDRKREARFQWRRALSLEPEEQVERIKRKLEVGLDVVLEEEGGIGAIEAAQD
ncbi:tetratricopeptide repeat protein [Jannaschia sp. S6380]|uniref:tetratricopeptide repeat protein n=1 Tax=Jannaschia sp. S6380 TaxID=2926408 RepID=UPI001FF62670|nr:tetratricopeptide repeat protein [Jannaschia sp. S6380]MCK0167615.1 tetratricopeptide repeat protein [Jannaschia sp. S6380]